MKFQPFEQPSSAKPPQERMSENTEGEQLLTKELPESVRTWAVQEKALHEQYYGRLPKNHETVKEVRKMVLECGRAFRYDLSAFQISIYDSFEVNASVNSHTQEIRLASELLKVLEYDSQKIQAVLAHEIGHAILHHLEIRQGRGKQGEFDDPLLRKVASYEEEYQADRISILAIHRLGRDTSAIRRALEDIEEFLVVHKLRPERAKERDELSWVAASHPHTRRRAMALRRLERLLPGSVARKEHCTRPDKNDFVARDVFSTRDFEKVFEFPFGTLIDVVWQDDRLKAAVAEGKTVISSAQDIDDLAPVEATEMLDAPPEIVEQWGETNQAEISHWFNQASYLAQDSDGFQDLIEDISRYSPNAIRTLLTSLNPVPYLSSEEVEKLEHESDRRAAFEGVLLGARLDLGLPVGLCLTVSALVNQLFEKDDSLRTSSGIKAYLEMMRDFRQRTGMFFPYQQAKFFLTSVQVFNGIDESERKDFLKLLLDYQDEIHHGPARELASEMLRPLYDWAQSFAPEMLPLSIGRKYVKVRPSSSMERILETNDKEKAREYLAASAGEYTFQNWTNAVAETSYNLWEEYRQGNAVSALDRAREADPGVAARLLSIEEFEDEYFGEKRNSYRRSRYASLEVENSVYSKLFALWNLAEYEDEMAARQTPQDRVLFFLETFPVVCARRDQKIVEILDLPKLEYVEDIVTIKDHLLAWEDIPLLLKLRDAFSHPVLKLVSSRRLWELYEQNETAFFEKIPVEELERAEKKLVDIPEEMITNELKAVLICFPESSYLRDELLNSYVDAAPTEASTLGFAALLTEPPPGVVGVRSEGLVAMSESMLDGLRLLSTTDKMETLLYLLGQNVFYSGIDQQFMSSRAQKEEFEEMRRNIMFRGYEYYKLIEEDNEDTYDEDESDFNEHSSINRKYLVQSPDAMILLSKFSGVPLILLQEQQKLVTTRREELDILSHTLIGPEGVMNDKDSNNFLGRAARVLVERAEFVATQEEKEPVERLLAFALQNCPRQKLPELFLNLWYISQTKSTTLPELTASLFREYGPVFVKAGQYLATQTASLPQEWTKAFRELSDKNVAGEKTLLYEYTNRHFGNETPFEDLGKKLGEGSMAAVYRGTLKNGREVAAKVLHPFISSEIDEDTDFLNKIVGFVNVNSARYGGVVLPSNLADVTRSIMKEEADLSNEQRNAVALSFILSSELEGVRFTIPEPIQEYSYPDFLVSEYKGGASIDDDEGLIKEQIDPGQVRKAVALEILRQVLADGVYQADVNPGNFSVSKAEDGRPVVAFFDTGHLGRLDSRDIKQLRSFIRLVLSKPTSDELGGAFAEMVQDHTEFSREQITNLVKAWVMSARIAPETGIDQTQKLFSHLLNFLADKKLVLKEQWVVLLRTLGLLQPMLREVSQEDTLRVLGPLLSSDES